MDHARNGRAAGIAAILLLGVAPFAGAVTGRWESIGINSPGPGVPTVHQVAFTDRGLVIATGLGVYRDAGGGSWDPLLRVGNPGQFGGRVYRAVLSVEANPSAPDVFLAGLGGGGVYRSADAGRTWDLVVTGSGFLALASAPSDASIVYASVLEPNLLQATTFRSSDGGSTWMAVPALGPSIVFALAVDPASSGVIYASVGAALGGLPAGLYVSRDGGDRWNRLSGGIPSDTFTVLASDPTVSGIVYAGSNANGVYRTDDGGVTWTAVNNGLGDLGVRAIAIDPQTPSIVYAGTMHGVYRSVDSGGRWLPLGLHQTQIFALAIDPASPSTVYAGIGGDVQRITLAPTEPCAADAETLCLNGGRFRAQILYRTAIVGSGGAGHAVPISDFAGGFWFFDPSNVEVVVKVLDGTTANGNFWVLYGALSNEDYTVTLTDTATGAIQSFIGGHGFPAGGSAADIAALPGSVPPAPLGGPPAPATAPKAAAIAGPCAPDGSTLCLLGGRFQARIAWKSEPDAPSASAPAVSLTGVSGYFWFFQRPNVEIALKVLDGTAINGHFWVFYASLSDVEYSVTVTDLQTRAEKVYDNPAGRLASLADTEAFP